MMAGSSASATSLLYSCVAYNARILIECTTPASSQASSVALDTLPHIPHEGSLQRLTFSYGGYDTHIISEPRQLAFLVVTNDSSRREVPFNYLDRVRKRFFEKFPESIDFSTITDHDAASFKRELRLLMDDAGQNDNIGNLKRELADAQVIIQTNIDGLRDRGETVDLLVQKTTVLQDTTTDFRRQARDLGRQMWWKDKKMTISIIGLVCLVGGITAGVIKAST